MDPNKTTCADHLMMKSDIMMRHADTLMRGARLKKMDADVMRRVSPKEAQIEASIASHMLQTASNMNREAKRLRKFAGDLRSDPRHNHTIADHMGILGTQPEQWRSQYAEVGRGYATGIKDWSSDLARKSERLMSMMDKIAKGQVKAPAGGRQGAPPAGRGSSPEKEPAEPAPGTEKEE
jgi:hypothetical protein